MTKAIVFATYCEDVRFERSGLSTYVGVFPPVLETRPFPIGISSIHAIVNLLVTRDLDTAEAKCELTVNGLPLGDGAATGILDDRPPADSLADDSFQGTLLMLRVDGLSIDMDPSQTPRQAVICVRFTCKGGTFYSNHFILKENLKWAPQGR